MALEVSKPSLSDDPSLLQDIGFRYPTAHRASHAAPDTTSQPLGVLLNKCSPSRLVAVLGEPDQVFVLGQGIFRHGAERGIPSPNNVPA